METARLCEEEARSMGVETTRARLEVITREKELSAVAAQCMVCVDASVPAGMILRLSMPLQELQRSIEENAGRNSTSASRYGKSMGGWTISQNLY
jgi:hypothetical protein